MYAVTSQSGFLLTTSVVQLQQSLRRVTVSLTIAFELDDCDQHIFSILVHSDTIWVRFKDQDQRLKVTGR